MRADSVLRGMLAVVLCLGFGRATASAAGDGGRAVEYIEGYTELHSYAPGETIRFHVSTTSPTFSITVSRVTYPWWKFDPALATLDGIAGSFYPKPAQPWLDAGWPVSAEMVVGEDWPSGCYMARFIADDGALKYHPFFVRPSQPGETSRMAFIGNFNTLAAYNEWGYRTFYTQPRAYKVSLLRPFRADDGRGRTQWLMRMLSHLEQMGYTMEYITEWDIEQDPEILRNYDVIIMAGHHEYVTTTFFDAVQDHHDRGGHMACFDADGMYWQVRYEDDGNTLVGYKEYAEQDDPMYGYVDCLVTAEWASDVLSRPSEALRGIQRNKLYFYFEDGDYVVQNASHWAFEGTGLQDGDILGTTMGVGEQDTLTPFSPANVDILLHAHRDVPKPNRQPPDGVDAAEMYAVFYADTPEYGFPDGNGGMVFTAGTITGWIRALYQQPDTPKVERITRNLLDRMLANPPPPGDGDPVDRHCIPCFADLDGDGNTDSLDFIAFLNLWAGGSMAADWNHDGVLDTRDFIAFLTEWAQGC